MTTDTDPSTPAASTPAPADNDFQALLDSAEHADNPADPKPGMPLTGKIIEHLPGQGLVVNLGLKRDGLVAQAQLDKLAELGQTFEVGQTVQVTVASVDDKETYYQVALPQPNKFQQDWEKAQKMLESKEIWEGMVAGYNKGGLIVKFGSLQAFVPTSHLTAIPQVEKGAERAPGLSYWVGRTLGFKIIEVDAQRRRLVLSQREAQKDYKAQQRTKTFGELAEGQVRQGVVTGLRDFGAFVDLGGADGLIHVSELSWQRITHPNELLKVGQTVEVEVIKIDHKQQRVGLSLKRRQTDPWHNITDRFQIGLVVTGQVKRVANFGAFVDLGDGVDGLIHISRLANQPTLTEGDSISVRVLSIDPNRQRIGLALVDPFKE